MEIDVNIPSCSDYPTKPTPPISPPLHRDYQSNKNQTIPTTTTKDPDFDSVFPDTSDNNDHKITLEDIFPDTSDDDEGMPIDFDMFAFDPTTATTTATTADQNRNQEDLSEMTLDEEFQQWEEEHYEAEDRAEQAAWPKSKWEILALDMNADIFAPIKVTTTATITKENDEFTAIITTEDKEANSKPGPPPNQPPQPMNDPKPITENQATPTTAIDRFDPPNFYDSDQEKSHPLAGNSRINDDNNHPKIKDAADEQQLIIENTTTVNDKFPILSGMFAKCTTSITTENNIRTDDDALTNTIAEAEEQSKD